jgi:hypothetical protein
MAAGSRSLRAQSALDRVDTNFCATKRGHDASQAAWDAARTPLNASRRVLVASDTTLAPSDRVVDPFDGASASRDLFENPRLIARRELCAAPFLPARPQRSLRLGGLPS